MSNIFFFYYFHKSFFILQFFLTVNNFIYTLGSNIMKAGSFEWNGLSNRKYAQKYFF